MFIEENHSFHYTSHNSSDQRKIDNSTDVNTGKDLLVLSILSQHSIAFRPIIMLELYKEQMLTVLSSEITYLSNNDLSNLIVDNLH